jgi:hypothetical protein
MKHAAVMGSGALMFIPNFIKIVSGIQRLMVGIHRQTESMMLA